jgi:hypothetical protein
MARRGPQANPHPEKNREPREKPPASFATGRNYSGNYSQFAWEITNSFAVGEWPQACQSQQNSGFVAISPWVP